MILLNLRLQCFSNTFLSSVTYSTYCHQRFVRRRNCSPYFKKCELLSLLLSPYYIIFSRFFLRHKLPDAAGLRSLRYTFFSSYFKKEPDLFYWPLAACYPRLLRRRRRWWVVVVGKRFFLSVLMRARRRGFRHFPPPFSSVEFFPRETCLPELLTGIMPALPPCSSW